MLVNNNKKSYLIKVFERTDSVMAPDASPDDSDIKIFGMLEDYPWNSDMEFRNGLQAILDLNPNPDQAEYLILRARCFYFSRQVLAWDS